MKGNKIKELRLSVGHTQKEFAELFGVTDVNQGQIERGLRKPNVVYVLKLMGLFNLSLKDTIEILNLEI